MKKLGDEDPLWVEKYNSAQPNKLIYKPKRPNFVELTSDHFNGLSGDTATLYEVAKFIEKLYDKWTKGS